MTGFQRLLANPTVVDFEVIVPIPTILRILDGITQRLPVEFWTGFSKIVGGYSEIVRIRFILSDRFGSDRRQIQFIDGDLVVRECLKIVDRHLTLFDMCWVEVVELLGERFVDE
ncbi:hypothetical protein A4G99_16135 [Haladaptatus sp. R4]|nr:hypothetical protein A4G99_16135 [Haladaptatus sp. R4]